MKIRKKVDDVLLLCGLLYTDEALCEEVCAFLTQSYGPLSHATDKIPFTHTDYYSDELGSVIYRKYLVFKKPISPDELSRIKTRTNEIETRYLLNGKRQINIDPGYLHLAKLVLASAKDFSHRISIGNGIFAEVTLLFANKSFQVLPWTYPDYKTPATIDFFNDVRNEWYAALRQERRDIENE
jgi:hypothetical protein